MFVVAAAGQVDSGRLLSPGRLPVQRPTGTVPGEVSPLFRRFPFLSSHGARAGQNSVLVLTPVHFVK